LKHRGRSSLALKCMTF